MDPMHLFRSGAQQKFAETTNDLHAGVTFVPGARHRHEMAGPAGRLSETIGGVPPNRVSVPGTPATAAPPGGGPTAVEILWNDLDTSLDQVIADTLQELNFPQGALESATQEELNAAIGQDVSRVPSDLAASAWQGLDTAARTMTSAPLGEHGLSHSALDDATNQGWQAALLRSSQQPSTGQMTIDAPPDERILREISSAVTRRQVVAAAGPKAPCATVTGVPASVMLMRTKKFPFPEDIVAAAELIASGASASGLRQRTKFGYDICVRLVAEFRAARHAGLTGTPPQAKQGSETQTFDTVHKAIQRHWPGNSRFNVTCGGAVVQYRVKTEHSAGNQPRLWQFEPRFDVQ